MPPLRYCHFKERSIQSHTRKLVGPLLVIVALLSACGVAPANQAPTTAPAAAQPTVGAAPTAAAQPTPTLEQVTVVGTEPTIAAAPTAAPTVQASGALAWRDQVLR